MIDIAGLLTDLKIEIRKSGKSVPKDSDKFLREVIACLVFPVNENYNSREEANVITCYCFRNNPTLEEFHSSDISYAAPTHCSGDGTRKEFKNIFGENFLSLGVGKIVEIAELD